MSKKTQPAPTSLLTALTLIARMSKSKRPVNTFAQMIASQFARGPYDWGSPHYTLAAQHAPFPLRYAQHLIRFSFVRAMFEANPFCTGMPVTVSTDKHNSHGHAVFGIVRSVTEQLAKSQWPCIITDMIVEVHVIPHYEVEWKKSLVWKEPPSHTVHIQPHAFLHPDYVPLPLNVPEVANVKFSLGNVDPLQWDVMARLKPTPRLPAQSEYPAPPNEPFLPNGSLPYPENNRVVVRAVEPALQKKRSHAEISDSGEVSSSTSIPTQFSLKDESRNNRPSPARKMRSNKETSPAAA